MLTTQTTLKDYLSQDSGPEGRQEFVDGEIIEMPPESPGNVLISLFLLQQLFQVVPLHWVRRNDTELVVSSSRVRIPDLMILGEDLALALADSRRSTITEEMPAPLLVVEVVSPGKDNQDRDYRYKRSEYAVRGIGEYWIIDPEQAKVTVLTLVDGLYEAEELRGSAVLQWSSPAQAQSQAQSGTLRLTVAQLLAPVS
jgi:Uma2 family endonuclease